MITLIFIISIIMVLVCMNKRMYKGEFIAFNISVFSLIAMAMLLIFYLFNIEDKILMYTNENQIIEKKLKETIQTHIENEQKTYQSLVKDTDVEALLVKYPELYSNTSIESQVDTYLANNREIKKLKEQKIKKKIFGWCLTFNIGANDK